MSKLKVLSLIVAASASGLVGWGAVEWRQERAETQARAAEFEKRQVELLRNEHERLRPEVAKRDLTAPIAPLSADTPKAKLEAAVNDLRSRLEKYEAEEEAQIEERWKKQIEETTARIRGLEFKTPVSYNVLDRSEIGRVLEAKFAELYTDEELDHIVAGYAAIGLLPENFPLKQTYIDLMGEQIAAFYDQHEHKLFMFTGATLTNAQNRVILSHELTHALQDQHFSLKNLPLEQKDNDDLAIAASALIEGDATVEMNQFMLEDLDSKGAMQAVMAMMAQNMEKLMNAPRFLRESLLFPYLEGAKFCTALQMRGPGTGFEPITKAYGRVPASTTQILHPEKYFANEAPIAVAWPSLEWKGEKAIFDNVMGEFYTRILLSEWGQSALAMKAAEGWRGDRYLVYRKGEVLVWRTAWGTTQEAAEFIVAAKGMLAQRYSATATARGENALQFTKESRTAVLTAAPEGTEVLLVHAPTPEECDALIQQFLPLNQ